MELSDYQEWAAQTDQHPREIDLQDKSPPTKSETIPLLGLIGEVGSLAVEYKKLLRDGAIHSQYREKLAEELGDILWYVADVATKAGLRLEDIAAENLRKTQDRFIRPKRRYSPEVNRVQLNLIDSHDTPRFLTCVRDDADSLRLAWTFVFSFPGAPCIFYGDEIGLVGRQDPDCRQPFPWEPSKWNAELRRFVQELISVRRTHPALRRGDYRSVYSDRGIHAFRRRIDGESILIALNAAGMAQTVRVDVSTERRSEPKPIFGRAEIEVHGDQIQLRLPARAGAMIIE